MDPMDWLEKDDLLRFFHRHKTEMSLMENPHTFLNQLRDHDLVPEDHYKKVSRMKSKDNIKNGLYGILDWLEKERSKSIKDFWRCVFREPILHQYPTLRELRNSLMDGSFHFETQEPETVETEETDEGKRKDLSDDEEGEENQASSVKKKMKLRSEKSVCDDEEEQAGPSSRSSPRKKSKKISFSSPLKKGEKNDIWTWTMFKHQLPVTCGQKEGSLNRDRLAKGEKCIAVGKQWFTPNEFQTFAGRKSCKNWKWSIRCQGISLGKLIKEGHLKAANYKRGCKKAKKSLFPSGDVVTDEEGEEQPEQQPQASSDSGRKVFKVTCGALAGTLHKKRFASGTRGKSIRTETSWMSPEEFIKKASCPTDASWRKDIKYEGEPLSVLLEANILSIDSLLCTCRNCNPSVTDLESQKNDDECSICKIEEEEEEELVVCDYCPRSFHQKCHLPHVEDTILGDDSIWMCTFCVFRTSREWLHWDELEREAVMSRQISQHAGMLQCQYLLLYLSSADEEQIFASNPCLYLQNYSMVIKTPMWLVNIADKLQEQLYKTVGEFVSDVQLIFTNCASYNRDNAEYLAAGNRLKELFDGEMKSVFNISE
ncbi:nuclear body protein SP140-like isoform X3 [Sebastes umbrosus]|uniref:nuclear body protein SP140-like isoform X3 n=1 Tax=Sebastes umbrosus TaxID=72105 RepID=UPI00189E8459|nr:nuclear body protein SP140-like isoform X3 [Sebastes umbrosus]